MKAGGKLLAGGQVGLEGDEEEMIELKGDHPGANIGRRENPELNKLRSYDRNYLSICTVREHARTMFVQQGEPNNE